MRQRQEQQVLQQQVLQQQVREQQELPQQVREQQEQLLPSYRKQPEQQQRSQ